MTLNFSGDIILGGGQWNSSLVFNTDKVSEQNFKIRQGSKGGDDTSSSVPTLKFLTNDNDSVLL